MNKLDCFFKKLSIFCYLIILISLTSCKGQNISQANSNIGLENIIVISKIDTVNELSKNIMLVYQDKKNNYWFGSWEDGLYQYNGKKILHFTNINGLPSNRIDEIKEDSSGNVYFTTNKGIFKFDGKNFINLKIAESDNQWKLASNDLWFKDGWDSNCVFRYDGSFLHKLQLPKTKIGEDLISKHPNYPNPYTIYSIYKDSKGNIWFGTAVLGAFRYNGKTFDWISENDVTEIHDGPSNGVRYIIEDKDGYFWFNSMFRYKIYDIKKPIKTDTDTSFYIRNKSIGSLDGLQNGNLNEYLSIAKDKNNELWIATYNKGVFHYYGKNISNFIVKDDTKAITLFSIYNDNFGNLWLGTHESGAYKYNGQTFERFKP